MSKELRRFCANFGAGDVYQAPLGRTVTHTDNIWFLCLAMNTNFARSFMVFERDAPAIGELFPRTEANWSVGNA